MQKLTMLVISTAAANFVLGNGNPDVEIGTVRWWIYCSISILLVLFAGIMSGLTLGLMSLSLMDLEVLQRSGTDVEKKRAGNIFWHCSRF